MRDHLDLLTDAMAASGTDVLMLGRLVPTTLLGVYSIAGVLAALPQEVTGRLISFVLFPAMAESARQGRGTLHENLGRARQALLPAVLTVVLGIALFAPAFFYYLYDARYHAAGWMAQLLMFKLWFYTLHEITAHTLLALGNSRALALGNVARLVATAAGCIAGYLVGGLPGLVLGAGAGGAAGYVTVALAAQAIMLGDADIVVAGGMEGMSSAPYLLPKARYGYRMGNGEVVDHMIKDGLWCALEGCHMGVTAENVATDHEISRADQDEFSYQSQRKTAEAWEAGRFSDEVVPVTIKSRKGETVVDRDEHFRPDTTTEVLGKLRPAFQPDGSVDVIYNTGLLRAP